MRGLTKQFANPPRKTGVPFYGDPDTIKHYLLNGDIRASDKEKPFPHKGAYLTVRDRNAERALTPYHAE